MQIEVKGLKKIEKELRDFNFKIPNIKYRFLTMIGTEALELLKINTPKDTGNLSESWVLQQSENEVVIMNDNQDLLGWITFGSIRHRPNPFIEVINHQVDNMVMKRLEAALAENHRYFKNMPKLNA